MSTTLNYHLISIFLSITIQYIAFAIDITNCDSYNGIPMHYCLKYYNSLHYLSYEYDCWGDYVQTHKYDNTDCSGGNPVASSKKCLPKDNCFCYNNPCTVSPFPSPTPQPTNSPITISPTKPPTSIPSAPPSQNPTSIPSISPYCNDIVVEIINLNGISTHDFMINEELTQFITNTTSIAIAKRAHDYDVDHNLFSVEYRTVSDNINITETVCVTLLYLLDVLNDVVVEESHLIANYIENKTVEYFKGMNNVYTDDLKVNVYWNSYLSENVPSLRIGIIKIPSFRITFSILGLFFVFALISLLDAKYYRQNDYFCFTSIIMASFEVSDTILDVLFAVLLLLLSLLNKDIEIVIACISCFIFIVIPITFSIFQLVQKAKKTWFNDDYLSIWLRDNGKILFFLSIITGSSYTAIEIVNCGAFKLEIFNMGLSNQQQIKYNTKRVVGVVFLENIPQMVIQIWYLLRFGADFLPILSMIFALISIILTILTLYTQRVIIRNQKMVKIEFDIIGDDIEPHLSTKTNGIKLKMSSLLGIKENLMEIEKPKLIAHGLRFEISLFINDVKCRNLDYKSMVNTSIKNGKLINIIKSEWNLIQTVGIQNVNCIMDDTHDKSVEMRKLNKYSSIITDEYKDQE